MTHRTPGTRGVPALRTRILSFIGGLVVLSLVGFALSLFQITEVNRLIDAVNHTSVPVSRQLTELLSDAEVFQREADRGLGYAHWNDAHWRPRSIPIWLEGVIGSGFVHLRDRVGERGEVRRANWIPAEQEWIVAWSRKAETDFADVRSEARALFTALEAKDQVAATQRWPRFTIALEGWIESLKYGKDEQDKTIRRSFARIEERVDRLRMGLQLILISVVALSLLLLWLGDRALKPLNNLAIWVRRVAERGGIQKADKSLLPEFHFSRRDEVNELAREFHRMATTLIEREETVETQKHRLREQNALLSQMGQLNRSILRSIESLLLVTDSSGTITQCNPAAASFLGSTEREIIGTPSGDWAKLRGLLMDLSALSGEAVSSSDAVQRRVLGDRIYAVRTQPLRDENLSGGTLWTIEDVTESDQMADRLKRAEHLAAVGRMSAQVAHEVRNPLHSIGLEAELALELMQAEKGELRPEVRQSVRSILQSVDRLQKITENYLRLSRLSSGVLTVVDVREVLESTLATYMPSCEKLGIQVDWKHDGTGPFEIRADRHLLEQAFGNLFRNAIQAVEAQSDRRIEWLMTQLETGKILVRIRDYGAGVAPEVREKLFVPFVTTRAQGTGLGLSFVKQVMDDLGASVDLAQVAGAGACFEMRFEPAQVHPAPPKFEEMKS